jgi:hypothetical protein
VQRDLGRLRLCALNGIDEPASHPLPAQHRVVVKQPVREPRMIWVIEDLDPPAREPCSV